MKDVYALTEYTPKGESKPKTRWTKVGVGFENKDGSLSLLLDALPVSGRLQVREREEKPQPEGEEAF